jgi:hypothetical protein
VHYKQDGTEGIRGRLFCWLATPFVGLSVLAAVVATTAPRHRGLKPRPTATFKYNLRRSVRPYLSKTRAGDNLVPGDQCSASATVVTMSVASGIGNGSGGEVRDQEITMAEMINRLKVIETMMHLLVPLKDQLAAIETTLKEYG